MKCIPGIYVNSSSMLPYADQIIRGEKKIETRNKDMLGMFVGQRVCIIRTVQGTKTQIVGSVLISRKEYRTKAELDGMRSQTLIPPGSKFDCYGDGKYCYYLSDPHPFRNPIPLDECKVVRKNRAYALIGDLKS